MTEKKPIGFSYKNKVQGQKKKGTDPERAEAAREEREAKKAIMAYLDQMPIDELGAIYHSKLNRLAVKLQQELGEMDVWHGIIQSKFIPK